jgi:hypothetical protein
MAAIKFNSDEQRHAYVALARFNNSFSNIVANLDDLEKDNIFDSKSLTVFRGYAKELQSQLNCKLLSTLQDVEEKQAFEFGKVRIAREHHLNPDRPAFGQRKKRK